VDPAVGHVIDVDASLGEDFFDVAVGQPEPHIPARGEHNRVRREPETRKRWPRHPLRSTTAVVRHPGSLTDASHRLAHGAFKTRWGTHHSPPLGSTYR
jgi:hypothetical protein